MIRFIPTPIGNPKDITLRAIEYFQEAELFFCEDTRQSKKFLRLLQERFGMRYPDAEFVSFNEHNGKDRLSQYTQDIATKNIIYLSDAGTPVISDPGQILVEYCQQNGIEYDILPGATAVTTVYAASGFESGKFLFFGFLPHKGKSRGNALSEVMQSQYDIVLYESPHRLQKTLEEIASKDPNRELFLAKELTKKYQKYYKDKASALAEEFKQTEIKGEWAIVIEGKAVEEKTLSLDDIERIDMPPKVKAKLLSQLSNKSVSEWYQELSSRNSR